MSPAVQATHTQRNTHSAIEYSAIELPTEFAFGKDAALVKDQFRSYLAGKNPEFSAEIHALQAAKRGLSPEKFAEELNAARLKLLLLFQSLLTECSEDDQKLGRSLQAVHAAKKYLEMEGVKTAIVRCGQSVALKILPGEQSHLNYYARWAQAHNNCRVLFEPYAFVTRQHGSSAFYSPNPNLIGISILDFGTPHELSNSRLHEYCHLLYETRRNRGDSSPELGMLLSTDKSRRIAKLPKEFPADYLEGYDKVLPVEELGVRLATTAHSVRKMSRLARHGKDISEEIKVLKEEIAMAVAMCRVIDKATQEAVTTLRRKKDLNGVAEVKMYDSVLWSGVKYRSSTGASAQIGLPLLQDLPRARESKEHIRGAMHTLGEYAFRSLAHLAELHFLRNILERRASQPHLEQIFKVYQQRNLPEVNMAMRAAVTKDPYYLNKLMRPNSKLRTMLEPFRGSAPAIHEVGKQKDVEYINTKTGRGIRVDKNGNFVAFVSKKDKAAS